MNRILLLCVLCMSMLLPSCLYRHHHNHNISISVSENEEGYRFTAIYPENKTRRIQQLVNSRISPSTLFQSADDYMDVNTTLKDQTSFYVKSSPGRLRIRINRTGNSPASYERIKLLCEDIKNGLKD